MSAKHNSLNDSLLFIFHSRRLLISFLFCPFNLFYFADCRRWRFRELMKFSNSGVGEIENAENYPQLSLFVVIRSGELDTLENRRFVLGRDNFSWDRRHESSECKKNWNSAAARDILNNIILLFWMTLQQREKKDDEIHSRKWKCSAWIIIATVSEQAEINLESVECLLKRIKKNGNNNIISLLSAMRTMSRAEDEDENFHIYDFPSLAIVVL